MRSAHSPGRRRRESARPRTPARRNSGLCRHCHRRIRSSRTCPLLRHRPNRGAGRRVQRRPRHHPAPILPGSPHRLFDDDANGRRLRLSTHRRRPQSRRQNPHRPHRHASHQRFRRAVPPPRCRTRRELCPRRIHPLQNQRAQRNVRQVPPPEKTNDYIPLRPTSTSFGPAISSTSSPKSPKISFHATGKPKSPTSSVKTCIR